MSDDERGSAGAGSTPGGDGPAAPRPADRGVVRAGDVTSIIEAAVTKAGSVLPGAEQALGPLPGSAAAVAPGGPAPGSAAGVAAAGLQVEPPADARGSGDASAGDSAVAAAGAPSAAPATSLWRPPVSGLPSTASAAAASDPALARILDAVLAARAAGRSLQLIGGGTKRFYGEVPSGEPLDLKPLYGISRYEPTELVVTVRAGTPLAELEAALAAQRQCLAFEPPHFGPEGTVGGMVAAGLAGPARPAVGGVRDYVLGATLLNGRGELLSFGGQVMKNVAGYDVSRLLAGSMGVLGVICEVSLKVLPLPAATATLRFEMPEAEALAQLQRWGAQPLPISASAWWRGMLVLRLAGAQAAVESAMARLGGDAIGPAMAGPFWAGLRDHTDEFFATGRQAMRNGAALWRLSLPQAAPAVPLPGEHLIEWGGAQRWVVTSASGQSIRELAARVGGHATAFAGDKSAGVFSPLPPAEARIQRALKRAFDPDRVFNPGRLYPDL